MLRLTQGRKKVVNIVVITFAMCLIGLLLVRSFDMWVSLVLSATGVLAVELGMRDLFLQAHCGVYENALITCGKLLKRSDIIAFPTLSYEKDSEDSSSVPPEMLKVVTNSHGTIFMEFVSKEERNKATEIISRWIE